MDSIDASTVLVSQSTTDPIIAVAEGSTKHVKFDHSNLPIKAVEDATGEADESDTDAEPEGDGTTKKLQPSQRKRQQHAVFDSWKINRVRNTSEEEKKARVQNEADELLTIRGLMNKAEANVIVNDPREYQLELFERAKKENTIAVLDTGSGKTLIAVLLLKHVLEQELTSRASGNPHRIAFFLVDVVTLVYQQFAVLEHNLDQQVDRFCGDMNVDSWNKATWAEHFQKNMAIVCTADVLLNCLSRGFISIEQINLLIFDEAHHTKKNHSYARIVKDFYLDVPIPKRPKVFGMTASPVDAKVDVIQAARELEDLLHAKIATASNLELLRNTVSRPMESVLVYTRLPNHYATSLCTQLENNFRGSRALSRLFTKAKLAASELGEWCADRLWMLALESEEAAKLERKTEHKFSTDALSRTALDLELQMINDAKEVVKQAEILMPQPSTTMVSPALSSKVICLKDFLQAEYENPTETRCIVFVQHRLSARLLSDLFQKFRSPHMRIGTLIGTRQAESGDLKVTIRDQMMMLMKFRKGEINVLFATSIAEEGLDIPMCNVIVRFDLYTTMIQYIQSRGRARHKQSKYVHMIEGHNSKHYWALDDVHKGEIKLRAFCQNQPEDRLLRGIEFDFDGALLKEKQYQVYTEPGTGAKLTFGTVLDQLSYFTACLPQNEETFARPMFILTFKGRRYHCEVLLPSTSPIRSVMGRGYSRKSIAKRSAAFEACLVLRQGGYLDANLLPIYHKQLPAMRNAQLALNIKKTNAYDVQIKPRLWEDSWGTVPAELSLVLIQIAEPALTLGERSLAPLLFLTREALPRIPNFPVHLKAGTKSDVSLTPIVSKLKVDEKTIKLLTNFTLQCFLDPFNKGFQYDVEHMSYWLAPVRHAKRDPTIDPQSLVDWEALEFVQANGQMRWNNSMSHSELANLFLIDPHSGALRYFTYCVRPDMHAEDRPPEGLARNNHKYFETILSYTCSLWKNSRDWLEKQDKNQPVIESFQIPFRRNWLDDFEEGDVTVKTQAFICPEPLNISSLSVPIAAMLFVFPSLIWRIDAYLVALEACEFLGLDIDVELALEAMTKDSDNTEEHRIEQVQYQRGMGKNYERLEFIGDSFLKMATSISLYAQNAGDDEFESHVKRMLMVCNKNLFKNAVDMKLFKYIRSQSFSRRTWYPEGLGMIKGKSTGKSKELGNKYQPQTHPLNDKTIADVCEALIGAALLSHTESGSMDMAVKAVTVLVKNSDHDVEKWDDYYKLYKMPAYQIAECTAAHLDLASQIEKKMGYKFKWPRVLQAAFTHPSWPYVWGNIPSYQRLEFLGDSLLDMVCINFLFFRYPDKDPQWLTEHKMAMVSNKFLGALCVRLKFHKHLKTNHNTLVFQISEFVEEIEAAEAESEGARDYWTTTKNPPKCLPDVVESYLGAIFVDSCFSFKVVEEFFEKHVRWYFEDMTIYDAFANNHPTTFLSNLLTNNFNCTHYRVLADEIPNADGTPSRVVSVVMVHFQIIADAESSSSKYAKIRASHRALEKLKGLAPWEFRKKYSCDCKDDSENSPTIDGNGEGHERAQAPNVQNVDDVIGSAI